MVVVGSVYEKNKIIKDPDQEIYARHFDRSLIRKLSLSRFAQAAHHFHQYKKLLLNGSSPFLTLPVMDNSS